MSKYVFCDLDFTLLNDSREISKDNYAAIKKFEEKGNHFIICSGRAPFAIEIYRDLLNSIDAITSNGAVIISNNRIIKNELLKKEIMLPIVEYAIKNNVNLRIFTSDNVYLLNQEKAPANAFVYNQSKNVNPEDVYDLIESSSIIKMVFAGEKEVLDKIKKDFEEMNMDIEITFSAKNFLDVNTINQNKGNGVLDYCRYNNINIADTISVGDNDNDLSMLKITGFSACPRNANDSVKQTVDYICTNDNNHSAIKEILEKIS